MLSFCDRLARSGTFQRRLWPQIGVSYFSPPFSLLYPYSPGVAVPLLFLISGLETPWTLLLLMCRDRHYGICQAWGGSSIAKTHGPRCGPLGTAPCALGPTSPWAPGISFLWALYEGAVALFDPFVCGTCVFSSRVVRSCRRTNVCSARSPNCRTCCSRMHEVSVLQYTATRVAH